jgi:hypothetical protein
MFSIKISVSYGPLQGVMSLFCANIWTLQSVCYKFVQDTNSRQTQQFYYIITFKAFGNYFYLFNLYIRYCIYSQVSDTCTFILTAPLIVRFWDPRMHYKCWYIGSVLQKAWWWLSRVETCCLKCNYIIKLLCLNGICILYEFEKQNGMTNVKLCVIKCIVPVSIL